MWWPLEWGVALHQAGDQAHAGWTGHPDTRRDGLWQTRTGTQGCIRHVDSVSRPQHHLRQVTPVQALLFFWLLQIQHIFQCLGVGGLLVFANVVWAPWNQYYNGKPWLPAVQVFFYFRAVLFASELGDIEIPLTGSSSARGRLTGVAMQEQTVMFNRSLVYEIWFRRQALISHTIQSLSPKWNMYSPCISNNKMWMMIYEQYTAFSMLCQVYSCSKHPCEGCITSCLIMLILYIKYASLFWKGFWGDEKLLVILQACSSINYSTACRTLFWAVWLQHGDQSFHPWLSAWNWKKILQGHVAIHFLVFCVNNLNTKMSRKNSCFYLLLCVYVCEWERVCVCVREKACVCVCVLPARFPCDEGKKLIPETQDTSNPQNLAADQFLVGMSKPFLVQRPATTWLLA